MGGIDAAPGLHPGRAGRVQLSHPHLAIGAGAVVLRERHVQHATHRGQARAACALTGVGIDRSSDLDPTAAVGAQMCDEDLPGVAVELIPGHVRDAPDRGEAGVLADIADRPDSADRLAPGRGHHGGQAENYGCHQAGR